MGLKEYRKKRDFSSSPEPTGGKPNGRKLLFVIQKHQASHLHYDFRLELHGVLKSWAVPKGLSMDPLVRRLAMEVEDHPWDYRNFEGIIPSGYGKGTVMVWDEGWYESAEENVKSDKKSQQHSINAQYWHGAIKFTLHGKKVKGTFAIYKDKNKGDNSWYIQKLDDQYATKADVTKKNRSVLTGKTLDEIAENPARKWTSKGEKDSENREQLVSAGIPAAFPSKVSPMKPALIKQPFDDDEWLYELKLDGYRVIAFVDGDHVALRSRSGLNYTKKFQVVADAFKSMELHAVIDGEMTFTGENGTPDFDALQSYKGEGPLLYYAFDILWKDGYDLQQLDLISRKEILLQSLQNSAFIEYTESFDRGEALFEEVKKRKLEGIVAKRKTSSYTQGGQTKDWLKIPVEKHQEFVIGGWIESDAGLAFKTLLFGAYKGGELLYAGHSGGGFTDKERESILKKLKKIESKKNPFKNKPDQEGQIHFVKPLLVADFKISAWTSSGKIRKPAIFQRLRTDKNPANVTFEVPLTAKQEKQVVERPEAKAPPRHENSAKTNETETEKSNWPMLLNEVVTSQDSVMLNGKKVMLTNVEKELWKGIPKARLIQYYNSVAPYILPHLRDRPQSLHTKNINAGAPGFYIKDMEGHQPKWADIFTVKRKHPKPGKSKLIHYFVCNDEAALIYLINLGCVDLNPWTSRTSEYLKPDYIIIDLDPADEDFEKVILATVGVKKMLEETGLTAFPKTSGKTGMHIYVPCSGFSFPEARKIATAMCRRVEADMPDLTTTENTIAKRGDKVFLDYNQNDEADTVAAPYSVRPWKQPNVSAPLDWKEIKKGLSPGDFTIDNMLERIERKGDLFDGVLNEKIRTHNNKILKRILKEA